MVIMVKSNFLDYILNHLFVLNECVVSGVLHQPVRKLLTSVWVAAKALFFGVPKRTGSTRNFCVAIHFSSSICHAPKPIYDL